VVKDHPEDPYYQNTLAIIYNGAGTLLTNQGRLAEADRYFQEAVKIAKPLADSDKSNVEFLRSLIDIQWNYGDCLRKQRRMDDALEHYSAGAATAQHLIAGRMVNSTFQENAAVTYYEIGEIWRCQGNAKTALEYFTASAQILQSPAVAQSATAGRNLELSRNRIAQINARQPVSCAEYHLPFTRSR
jgi:tetratricopeptide (TPR) repeat protein